MGNKAIIILLWLSLFVGAVLTQRMFTGSKSGVRTHGMFLDEIVDNLTRISFDATPRRSGTTGPSMADAALSDHLLANKASLLKCRDMILPETGRPRELFELSFDIVNSTSSDAKILSRLVDVRLERSSTRLSEREEQCLTDAFSSVTFEDPSAPSSRVFYELCLKPAQPSPPLTARS